MSFLHFQQNLNPGVFTANPQHQLGGQDGSNSQLDQTQNSRNPISESSNRCVFLNKFQESIDPFP